MASKKRLPVAQRSGRVRSLARAVGFVAAASVYWVLPASPFLTFDDLDADREFGVAELSAFEFDVDPLTTGSIDSPFDHEVFRGANRSAKTDRYRPAMNAEEFVAGFAELRTHIAALRAGPTDPEPDVPGADLLPATGDVAGEETLALASLGGAEAGSDALEAINALSGEETAAPEGPFPVAVPERLAYARENAEPTSHTGTYMPAMRISEREHWCMATAIYFEARGESYRGQVAVAQVVRNRVAHGHYPNSICGVVFQNQTWRNRCQFSFACDGRPERVTEPEPWKQAQEIATKMMEGELYLSEVGNATHYHANYVYPHWAPRMTRMARIDHHIFYRFRNG